jgi:hypothetical protein
MLNGEIGQPYGLGGERSLLAFYEYTGVDFAAKNITEKACNGGMCAEAFLL